MKVPVSPAVFSAAFCVAYAVVFAMNLPLFLYYPLRGEFALGWLPVAGHGPAMAWYGLLASAGAIALLAALVVPDRWIVARLRGLLWLFPCAAMLACAWLLRNFF